MQPFRRGSYPADALGGSAKLVRILVFCGLLLGISACNGCSSDKPYTPFGVASALPAPPADPAEADGGPKAPTPGASVGFAARKAELVPNDLHTLRAGESDLVAPDSRHFAQVLNADFDGDQKIDTLALLAPDPQAKDLPPVELWYFPHGEPGRAVATLPGFVPNSPDCPLSVTLTQTGPHSATLDATAACQGTLIARSPSRALVMLSPSMDRPILLTLRAAAAAPNETLNFTVDSSDLDQDGRDDIRLTVSVSALGSSEPASADLAWLDRAAGASRAASEPQVSLLRLATRIGRGARIKHGSRDPERTRNVIRLLSSLCAEGGVARVFDEDGVPFRCGDLTHVGDLLLAGEVASALAQGDVEEAFATLGRDGWYFTRLSAAARKAIEHDLLRAVNRVDAHEPFVARALPTQLRAPHFSPLWFEADGALLIRGDTGVTRIAPGHATELPLSVEAGAPSWPLELASASGLRLTGTSHACDRSELLFNLSDETHPLPPLTARLLAARPASCAGHGSGPPVSIAPLAFEGGTLEALVAGSHLNLGPSGAPASGGLPRLGTPRSPDGRLLVSATPLGLLITGDRKELWQLSGLSAHANPAQLSDCVVANDARAVACVESGRALIFERER